MRTAKLTPVAARLQEVEGKVDQHVIPKEVCGGFMPSSAQLHPDAQQKNVL